MNTSSVNITILDIIHRPDSLNPVGVVADVWRQRLYLSIGPNSGGPPEDGDRIQSPKLLCFKQKTWRWIMSRIVIAILLYQCHKPIDPICCIGEEYELAWNSFQVMASSINSVR
jgi:hypothetical protein